MLGAAVAFDFGVFGGEAHIAAPALYAFIAFAYTRAETAQVGRVAGAPRPDALVGCVGVAQRGAAGLAEPDGVGAGAGVAGEGGGGEGWRWGRVCQGEIRRGWAEGVVGER